VELEPEPKQTAAVAAAERLLALARNRWIGGIATHVTAENAALANERAAVDLNTGR